MIAMNRRHAPVLMRRGKRAMSSALRKALQSATRTAAGKKGLRRLRKFWKAEPTFVGKFDDQALKKFNLGALVSMGRSNRVVLKLKGASKTETLRGKWQPYTDANGRRILILTGRKIKPPFREIGVAPETWYYPSKAMEQAGTHKGQTMWRHLHTDDGGKPPRVFADRNGKIDKDSNFVYAKGTYSVTDWIRR